LKFARARIADQTDMPDQAAGLAAQERDLKAAGAERIFGEQVSSTAKRVKLTECLASAPHTGPEE
jgi:hypothetical protein